MRWLGGALYMVAAAAFTGAAVLGPGAEVLLVGGVPAALGGTMLWWRKPRPQPTALQEPVVSRLQEQIAEMESVVASLEREVVVLKTDREFYQQLYAPAAEPARRIEAAGGAERRDG
jgi:hypothetical protein